MQRATELVLPSPQSCLDTITLDVGGMKCAGCIRAVERQLLNYPGVQSACVNLVTQVARVECEAGAVEPDALAQRLTATGFPTQPRFAQREGSIQNAPIFLAERQKAEAQHLIQNLAIAAVLLLLSGLGHLGQWQGWAIPGLGNVWFHAALATGALVGPGRPILVDGWRGLRHNVPNMNTLVGLGTLSAYGTSLVALLWPHLRWECFFDEPVMLLGAILLGRTLEHQARNRAAASLLALLNLQPKTARLIADPTIHPEAPMQNAVDIPAHHVRVGDWLWVVPGEQIPVDGTVGIGQTTVDESMVTGESVPVLKQSGDPVIAGTLNQSGAIALQATRTGQETTLSRIIELVESAQTRKAPIQRLADTVAGFFVYGVMAIATLTFLFWYGLGTHVWPEILVPGSVSAWTSGHEISHMGSHLMNVHSTHPLMISHLMDFKGGLTEQGSLEPWPMSSLLLSLKLAIAVLVIACPCALGLATPTAILVGTGVGARMGLLIRGGDVLERLRQIDTVVFDKTGTLTTGQPEVRDCVVEQTSQQKNLCPETMLQWAATVESGARHPLALAIREAAQRQGLPLLSGSDFQTFPGLGVSAWVEERRIQLGTAPWFGQEGIIISPHLLNQGEQLMARGQSVVFVAADRECVGFISVMDSLKPEASAVVTQLHHLGLQVRLLTGDRPEVAAAIAQSLDLPADHVIAGVLPDGKAQAIAHLQEQGHQVVMVGDGINDAPALAQANVGIALRSGTDVALETAQVVLMRDRLLDIGVAIQLSRRTFRTIQQNLVGAVGYNILAIPVAAGCLLLHWGVILSPVAAATLMAMSSVTVVTNSLLLQRFDA